MFEPNEIEEKRFAQALRGYKVEEVRLFLRAVAESYRKLLVESHRREEGLQRLEEELAEFKRRESLLQDMLLSAQKAAQQTRENAEREAQLVLKQAEMQSDELLRRARLKAHQVERGIMDLKLERNQAAEELLSLARRLETLVETLREEAEDADRVSVLPPRESDAG